MTMRWLASVIVLLAAGCTMTADPTSWVIGQGRTLADPQDYDDCLHKARYAETFASENEGQIDRPLLEICMRAHGYQPR
jgi:hypothetical protein